MDAAGDALGSGALTVLPPDLQDRARRNRANPSPLTAPSAPPAPPAAAPVAPPAPRQPAADEPPAARPGIEQTEHVLRLANDVRVLTYAIAYMRKQLTEAVESAGHEAKARAAAEAELAGVRGAAPAELDKARADAQRAHTEAQRAIAEAQRANTEVQRLTAETHQLRQALQGAHHQTEQWAEQARRAEAKLKAGAEGANAHIARLTEQAAAHEAAFNQLRQTAADQRAELEKARAERDAAAQRCAELEAELARERSRQHPRGNIAAVAVPPAHGLATTEPLAPVLVPVPPTAGAGVPTEIHEGHPLSLAEQIDLDEWQRDALSAWADAGHRGVVESVTSDGNAGLALWAIGRALDAGMKVLVVTPTAERVEQWYERIAVAVATKQVGKHSGRGNNRLAAYDVVVAAAPSVAKEPVFEPGLGVLLVADDVAEFGTEATSRALDDSYTWRLGLTLSYTRDDDGIATYLDRYFGGVTFSLGYNRALAEQAVASFDLALVSVLFTSSEQAEYDACEAATLAGGGAGAGAAKAAVRAYLKAVARRDEILAGTSARDAALRALAAAVQDSGGALVVAPTAHVADHVARVMAERGCTATPIRSGNAGEARLRRLGRTEDDDDRDSWLLVSPRGAASPADANEVDLAIVVSPARSRRQLVARWDRMLDGLRGGGHVRVVLLYVEASIEDDAAGEGPIATVMHHARRLQHFTARDTESLLDFLAAGRRVVTLPPEPAAAADRPYPSNAPLA